MRWGAARGDLTETNDFIGGPAEDADQASLELVEGVLQLLRLAEQ